MYKGLKTLRLGEIVYDVFPEGLRIRGAPLKVTSRFSG